MTTATAEPPEGARRAAWDFVLMMLTVGLLAALGTQSFIGTIYVWWAQRTDPGFMEARYAGFVELMNAVAAPQVVALVVVMGLCVPKRLLARRALVAVSAAMAALGIGVWAATGSLVKGLGAYLAAASLIQVAVVVLTMAGAPSLTYLSRGRVAKAGSGLLHLGFVIFMLVVVALQDSPFMLATFWFATICTVAGCAMSFYAGSWGREEG